MAPKLDGTTLRASGGHGEVAGHGGGGQRERVCVFGLCADVILEALLWKKEWVAFCLWRVD